MLTDDPLQRPATPPRTEFIPCHLRPLSLRTAVRFASHLVAGLAFLGGIVLLLLLLLAAGVIIEMVWESMSLGEAVYFVLITALTIGYGDLTPQSTMGRVVAPCLGLVGLLLTGVVIAIAVRALDFTIQEEVARQAEEDTPPPHAPDGPSA